ncbi:site-specific integrase [Umezawaea sp. Da 62-37]|uniref:tyrosine-type recombinase/integrase n=1 Tax=Umezawaea sp. Da 62-37 TaxID=3075927 RepID=UPI0028F6F76A|nr:site-specific integrase [Umezawaea sp. Da 62-37]WNV84754.1 site-specific integrase [Umezawaea sp. Da 62-37]
MADDPAKIELLRELIRQLGIDPSSLLPAQSAPTVSTYLPKVLAAASPSQLRRYGVHWTRAVEAFGGRRVDQVTPSDVLALRRLATRRAQVRSNTRKGRYAGECAVRAMRMFFRLATADGLLRPGVDPAAKIEFERRLPTVRRALTPKEMMAINHVVVTTGRDVALDSLLLRLHTETACRRAGALGLRLADLDSESCAVRLREKFGTERWQPISPTLVALLRDHAESRGVRHRDDALLRHSNGTALTGRRYDLLWKRVQTNLAWAGKLGVTAHWLRHTTLTWVERHFGYAVARAYAGHTDTKGGSTLTYIKGMPQEVARALSAYTCERHPMAELGHL